MERKIIIFELFIPTLVTLDKKPIRIGINIIREVKNASYTIILQ